MDIAFLLNQDLPEGKCNGLKKAILKFNNKDYTTIKIQINECLNEVVLNTDMPKHTSYITLNIPSSYSQNATILTGIRAVDNSNDVYISGTSLSPNNPTSSHIYKGSISGDGTWNLLNYKGNSSYYSTIYGPNSLPDGNIQAAGSYSLAAGAQQYGFLYQGSLDGSGSWTDLNLQSIAASTVKDVFAHSTMGGLLVGAYSLASSSHRAGAFIYDIEHDWYDNLVYNDAASITAYGIWHNSGTSYTIAGGVSTPQPRSFTVNWDSSSRTASDWQLFSYSNDLLYSFESHFEGITASHNGYNLCGVSGDAKHKNAYTSFVKLDNSDQSLWVDFAYPGKSLTTCTTVYENNLLGVYIDNQSLNGFIATFHE